MKRSFPVKPLLSELERDKDLLKSWPEKRFEGLTLFRALAFFSFGTTAEKIGALVFRAKLRPNPNFHSNNFFLRMRRPPLKKIRSFSWSFYDISATAADTAIVGFPGCVVVLICTPLVMTAEKIGALVLRMSKDSNSFHHLEEAANLRVGCRTELEFTWYNDWARVKFSYDEKWVQCML